jgi:hypothetical protein
VSTPQAVAARNRLTRLRARPAAASSPGQAALAVLRQGNEKPRSIRKHRAPAVFRSCVDVIRPPATISYARPGGFAWVAGRARLRDQARLRLVAGRSAGDPRFRVPSGRADPRSR